MVDPALALVNSNIRKEVIPIFYGANRFVIEIDDYSHDSTAQPILRSWYRRRTDCVKFIKHVAAFMNHPWRDVQLSATITKQRTFLIEFQGLQERGPKCVCKLESVKQILDGPGVGDTLAGHLMLAWHRDLVASIAINNTDLICPACEGAMSEWPVEEEVQDEEAEENAVLSDRTTRKRKRNKVKLHGSRKVPRLPDRPGRWKGESLTRKMESLFAGGTILENVWHPELREYYTRFHASRMAEVEDAREERVEVNPVEEQGMQ